MAKVKKSNKNKIIIPICILLVIAIVVTSVVLVNKNKDVETVSLTTIATDGISETVSATGEISSGAVREYKAASVATVKEVFVKVGDKVKKGDVLATFDTEALDSQINSLQSTYDGAVTAYAQAVASQKAAQVKLTSINKQIASLESKLEKAKKQVQTTTTKKTTTKKTTTTTTKAQKTTKKATSTTKKVATTSDPDYYDPTISDYTNMMEAVTELVDVIGSLTDDVEQTNAATRIVMEAINQEIENGNLSSDAIAESVGKAVSDAIDAGMVKFVDSGVAVEAIQAAVASVNWAAVGKGFGETYSVQIASLEMQLASLYAEKELFTVQADPSVANAQKKVRDSSKEALDTLKKTQAELQAGWKASIKGVVTECNLVAGGQTTLIETGIKIENQKTMTVTISLGEYDVHKVKVGMPATIKTAYGEYSGEVATIAPTATGGSQGSILDNVGSMAGVSGLSSLTSSGAGVKCTVTVNEPDENIIAGFDASVEILVGEYKGVPVVPIESMVLEKDGTYVYLYDAEESTVTKTKIETGAISDSAYEVTSGLSIGDQIVATPTTYPEDTFKVKIGTKK